MECGCHGAAGASHRAVKWTALAGLLGSLGVCTACCLPPFLLASIGVAGAWVGGLEALAPYKWLFLVATSAFLGYGFYAAYWRRARCSAKTVVCSVTRGDRAVRRWLWIATVLAITGMMFEQVQRLLG